MRIEKTNAEPRIRLGKLAMELVAPLVKPGEPVTKEIMEAALQLKKSAAAEKEHKLVERISEQIESLTVLLENSKRQIPAKADDDVMKEVINQLSQISEYHSDSIKHREYLLMSVSMLSSEIRGLKRMIGFLAAAGSADEKEVYEATMKGMERLNLGVDLFREREGIKIPDVEKDHRDRVAYFENAGRDVCHEKEHETQEKEYER